MESKDKEVLDYFIDHTKEKFDEIKTDLKDIREDIKSLNKFKWKLTGIAGFVIAIIEFVKTWIERHGS